MKFTPRPSPRPRTIEAISIVERVLSEVDAIADEVVDQTAALVRIPGIGGTAAENDAQSHVVGLLAQEGLDVDHWRLALDALTADTAGEGGVVAPCRGDEGVGARGGRSANAGLVVAAGLDGADRGEDSGEVAAVNRT